MPTDCSGVAWLHDTDSSLGGAAQEWELSSTPTDITTALAEDEIILDFGQSYAATYDTTNTDCMVSLWIWIITHLNQQNSTGPEYIQIRFNLLPIYIPTGPIRGKKSTTQRSSGGGSG